ncbi:glucosaminidase domain-containing protein [Bacillus velezensis]|uniref:glucosaminidase domain-containing protein n=1 Tax=Bacillus velezensis TaxID=492670 RepID=UPI003EBAE3FA
MSFIESIAKDAQRAGKEGSILPSVIIAQAILESNWGRSGLTDKAKNLFGIKGIGSNGSVSMKTGEHFNGKDVVITDAFRAYKSFYDSIKDLVSLYNRLDRYKAVRGEKDYKKACRAIKAGGYATDPKYADKLISVIESNNLTKYDAKSSGGSSAPKVGKTYTVKAGDNLTKIAAAAHVSVNDIVKENGIKNPNLIRVGQVLRISGAAPASAEFYTVKPGDNLTKIGKKFGISVSTLTTVNRIPDPNKIFAGQRLRVK